VDASRNRDRFTTVGGTRRRSGSALSGDQKKKAWYPDTILVVVTLFLVLAGVLAVFDASYVYATQSDSTGGDSLYFLKRQAVFAVIGLILYYVGYRIDYRAYRPHAQNAYRLALALLVLVLIVGSEHGVSRSWIEIGLFRFQPSEFAKLLMILFLADVLSKPMSRIRNFDKGFRPVVIPVAIVCLLVVAEKDIGVAFILGTICLAMIIAGGARLRHIAVVVALGLAVLVVLLMIWPEARSRVMSHFTAGGSGSGDNYQITQSLVALGSGGPLGKGLGMSRAKWLYLPAQRTDFIMAVIGEELGLVGSLSLVALFGILTWRGIVIAQRSRDAFGSLMAIGILLVISGQAFINMAVVTALAPTTGITLPLISYGGSSLVMSLFALGVLANISRRAPCPPEYLLTDETNSGPDRRRNGRSHLSGSKRR